jgi:hypothetical protein
MGLVSFIDRIGHTNPQAKSCVAPWKCKTAYGMVLSESWGLSGEPWTYQI